MATALNQPSADNLREWRESQGLSPQEIAERMRTELKKESLHFTSVTKMEKEGSYKVTAIRAYAKAVGLDFYVAIPIFETLALRHSLEKKSKSAE